MPNLSYNHVYALKQVYVPVWLSLHFMYLILAPFVLNREALRERARATVPARLSNHPQTPRQIAPARGFAVAD